MTVTVVAVSESSRSLTGSAGDEAQPEDAVSITAATTAVLPKQANGNARLMMRYPELLL